MEVQPASATNVNAKRTRAPEGIMVRKARPRSASNIPKAGGAAIECPRASDG